MKKMLSKTTKLVKKLRPKSAILGFVEVLEYEKIEGWVIHKKGQALVLTLTYGGETYELTPLWHQRDDVAAQYGPEFQNAGFTCRIPKKVSNLFKLNGVSSDQFALKASNVPLTFVAQALVAEGQPSLSHSSIATTETSIPLASGGSAQIELPKRKQQYQALDIEDKENGLKIYVNEIKNFVISMTLLLEEQQAISEFIPIVTLDNQNQDWKVFVSNEAIFPNGGKLAAKAQQQFGYVIEIEIPGYVWKTVQASNLKLNLEFKKIAKSISLVIKEESCLEWLEGLAGQSWPSTSEEQYTVLLALEHLRYSNLLQKLEPNSQSFFRDYAEVMNLAEFIGKDSATDQTIPSQESMVSLKTRALWDAQKALNQLLINDRSDLNKNIEKVIKSKKLTGEVKYNFIKSVIPLMVKHQSIHNLNREYDLKSYYILDHSDNAWEVTIAIAVLIAEKQVNRATDAMYRLAKMVNAGWLNTECLWFAVTQMNSLELDGEVSQEQAEKMRYAFLAIVESFNGEWFSRLHDHMLHKAMIALLQYLPLMTDYQKSDVIQACIKHYGLSPDFWQAFDQAELIIEDSVFQRARHNWKMTYEQFFNCANLTDNFSSLVKALKFFQSNKNPEAVMFMRELVNRLLQDENLDQSLLIEIIEELSRDQDLELVRYVAHPLVKDETAKTIIDKHQTQIYQALRLNTERDTSVTYLAQRNAAKAIRNQEPIDQSVAALHNWSAMFLSVDLLANRLIEQPQDIDAVLIKLDSVVQQVIAESKENFYLPAPVCAALANLSQHTQNIQVENWLLDIRRLLKQKFGKLHDELFETKPANQKITRPGWPQDTLVVIYSCKAYLDSRIKAIRETWIKDLVARGIPYLILVGDGNDEIDGDILALNVSDTYEDLPQKSLKLFDWVLNNTDAQYVLKIDDDCYLDVDKYFDTLSYRKHHYYGRVIHRTIGGMDRTWHHSKSKTLRAQNAIDKSPEPSIYCDGGGGYTLSRCAMAALSQSTQTIEGKRLTANSFMEDKLIGDLLALSHFVPSNEDYECYQRRRTFGEAIPVGMYENSFYPSKITPSLAVHLDTDKDQGVAEQKHIKSELWPKKIWSSCWEIGIKVNANQLELLTSIEKTYQLTMKELIVVATMRNEMIMLPHFLKHYRLLGVESFIISDNCSDDGTREYLMNQPDVILYSSDTEYKSSHYGVAWQQAILANHCVGKWALIVDADELLVYKNWRSESLLSYVKKAEKEGADCIRTDMVDMYPFGDLNEADFSKNEPFIVANWHDNDPLIEWRLGSGFFSSQHSTVSRLRHRIDKNAEPNAFTSQKYALVKYNPWMRMSQGIHDIAGVNLYSQTLQFAHFKYHAGFKQKIEDEIKRKQHYDGAKEYKRYASMIAEAKGGFGMKQISTQLDI